MSEIADCKRALAACESALEAQQAENSRLMQLLKPIGSFSVDSNNQISFKGDAGVKLSQGKHVAFIFPINEG